MSIMDSKFKHNYFRRVLSVFCLVLVLSLILLAFMEFPVPQVKAIDASGYEDFEDVSDITIVTTGGGTCEQSSEQKHGGTYSLKVNSTIAQTAYGEFRQIGDYLYQNGINNFTIHIYTHPSWNEPSSFIEALRLNGYDQEGGFKNVFTVVVGEDGKFWYGKTGPTGWTELTKKADSSSYSLSDSAWHKIEVRFDLLHSRFRLWVNGSDESNIILCHQLNTTNEATYNSPLIKIGDTMGTNPTYNETGIIYYDDLYINGWNIFGFTTEAYGFNNLQRYANNPLNVPGVTDSGTATNQSIHADLLYFEEGRDGYKYWLYQTPYHDAAAEDENPNLDRSNDAITWYGHGVGGVTNPLFKYQDVRTAWSNNNVSHLADVGVCFNGAKFLLVFTAAMSYPDEDWLGIAESNDGKTGWTIYNQPILKPSDFDGVYWVGTSLKSSSIIYEDGTYKLWFTTGQTGEVLAMAYATSTNAYSWTLYDRDGDGEPDPIMYRSFEGQTDHPWHSRVVKHQSLYINVFCIGLGTGDNDEELAISTDGVYFERFDSNGDGDPDPILVRGEGGSWEGSGLYAVGFVIVGRTITMIYPGFNLTTMKFYLGLATGVFSLTYTFKGLYSETSGEFLTDGVNVTAYFIDGSSPTTFEVNGTYSVAWDSKPQYFHFELGSNDREYWVGDTEYAATIYIFKDTLTSYTINFNDLGALLTRYSFVIAKRYVNGTLHTVEKCKADFEDKVRFNLRADTHYTIAVMDTVSFTFGEVLFVAGDTDVTLTVKPLEFTQEALLEHEYVHMYAYRSSDGCNITFSYEDLYPGTTLVNYTVYYENGTQAWTDSSGLIVYSPTWTNADNETHYYAEMLCTHTEFGTLTYRIWLQGLLSVTPTPWNIDFLWPSSPFDTSTLIPIGLIVAVFCVFSALNVPVGCLAGTVTATILSDMGLQWISIPIALLIGAWAFTILVAIVYAKRRVVVT